MAASAGYRGRGGVFVKLRVIVAERLRESSSLAHAFMHVAGIHNRAEAVDAPCVAANRSVQHVSSTQAGSHDARA
jgi:hypothetical protein